MDERGSIPGWDRDFFSLNNSVQSGSEAHAASYPAGTGDPFPESKATGA
jgi:hypothetical protein